MEMYPINRKTEILVCETVDDAYTFGAIRFVNLAVKAITEHGSFSVALSGGSTPKRMYELISTIGSKDRVNWSKVNLFWSDERAVPETDANSNYAMAMHYFSKPPFNTARVFRMHADSKDLELAAHDYERLIRQHCYEERFDLVLLGLGADCHTASLFPQTKALEISDRLVCPNFVPQLNTWRMTLTFSCINQADKNLVLVTGKEKADALRNVFTATPDVMLYPAQRLGTGLATVLYITDQETVKESALFAI